MPHGKGYFKKQDNNPHTQTKEISERKKEISIEVMPEEIKNKGEGTSGSDRWYLGTVNRDVGSIHSDFCELTAVELCESKNIAVYPIVGWWRERSYLDKYDSTIRYSLVVSLSTPKQDVDFYTPIMTEIGNVVEINI